MNDAQTWDVYLEPSARETYEHHDLENAEGKEEESQFTPPAPPAIGIQFSTFESGGTYQSYAKYNGFTKRIDHRRNLKI